MVRHPDLARAQNTCGGSTRAANPRRTLSAAQQRPAGHGGLKEDRASGQQRDDRPSPPDHVDRCGGTTFRHGGGGGGGVVPRQCQRASSSSWKTMSSNIDRGCPRFWTKRSRAGSPGAQSKWIQTAYGNWIRWSPPTPRAVEAPQDSVVVVRSSQGTAAKSTAVRATRVEKTRQTEAAEVQLKRKVKALEKKCAELQQRVKAAEEASGTIAQERSKRERELTVLLKVAQQKAEQAERDWKYCADGWNNTSKKLVDLMLQVDRCPYCGD